MGTESEQNHAKPADAAPDPHVRKTEVESAIPASLSTGAYLGALIKDRYLIESVLGSGGIGVVYLARDQKLIERRVVIKVLHQSVVDSELGGWLGKKFQHEIEALSRIDHPGVVGVLDTGEMPDGRAYFVMQYVEGMTLRACMNAQGAEGMDLGKVALLVKQMGQAMSAAHEKGVLHRDMKPENIMLQQLVEGEDLVKLIDFGIARVIDPKFAPETQATMIAGTPPYMAPEQIRGRPSAASDIFSLGAIAYEMITGFVPFKANTPISLYEAQRDGVKVKPSEVRQMLPLAAEEVILKALSFDESARYIRARDFGDELSSALTGDYELSQNGPFSRRPKPEDLSTNVNVPRSTVHDAAISVERVEKKRISRFGRLVIALSLLIAIIAGALLPGPKPKPPITPRTERSLNYWVMVQKYRDGKPYESPFKL